MRDIPMALSANSSSSSQQPANSNADYEKRNEQQQQGQQQSTLINEISTLQSRLRELDDGSPNNAMNRPRSQSALMGTGREPPQGESMLVNQLRKELSKMEHEKADLELTLMNQMSSLAYENQTTIDGLHARLAQSEKLVESLQQQNTSSTPNDKPSSTNHLELHRLRKSLNDEKDMRRALEEERDARHQEVERTREERDACEKENATMKQELQHVKHQMSELKSSNSNLSNQVKILKAEKEEADKVIEALQSSDNQQSLVSDLQAKHKATLAELEKSHQGQMSEMKQSYQQRCSQLEKEMAQKFDNKKKPNGVGSLHNKIAAVEAEKEDLEQQIAELTECLEQEQSMNQALEQSLEEHAQNNDKLWYSLEESQNRCKMLEQELSQQFEESHEKGDLRKENEMLSNQIAAIHEQCVSEQEKSSKLKATLDAERSTNSKLRLSLRQHQQRYEELNRNLHRNHSGIGMVNGNKGAPADRDKKQLSNQLAQVQEQLAKEKAKTKELEAAVAEHQQVIEEHVQSTAGRRQSDLGALENAQLELQSVLNSYQSDMARLEQKVAQAEQQVIERNRQNQRLEVEINEERRIRKSLTAQLSQANTANQKHVETSLNNSMVSTLADENSQSSEAEVQRLRKENARLSDELKMRTRMGDKVDPAEIEFLRKQNKLLGNGLHAEEVKELEALREKTKALDDEVTELRYTTNVSQPKVELTQLRKQNAELLNELQAVKQELASSIEKGSQQQSKWGETFSSPPRRGSRHASPSPMGRAPPSPSPRKPSTEHSTSNMQTPPLSPPLTMTTKKNQSSKQESPRTPVRGIVESFEHRISISRTNSNASLAAFAEAAQGQRMSRTNSNASLTEAAVQAAFASQTQGQQGALSSELEDTRRELHEERATVQDLRRKLNSETTLVENLKSELARLEETDAKRAQLEEALESSEQDILDLEATVKELENRAMDYGDIQEAMEQYRVTVNDLQSQLNAETEQVATLKSELSKVEQSDNDRTKLQGQLQDREAEVLRLRSRVNELEDMMLEAGGANEALEQERRKCRDLQSNLDTKLELVSNLRETLSNTEATLEQERSGIHDLQSQIEAQSEVVTTLRDELTKTDSLLEEEKKKAARMQSQLNSESGVVATLREELADMETKINQEKNSARNLQQNLASESDLVSSLRNEISRMDGIEAAHAKLKNQVLEHEQENKRLRFQVGELEVLLSNAQSKVSDSSEVEELKSELAQADEAKRGYERKLFDVRAEMEVLSGEIANMGTALKDCEFQNQKLKDEASSYKASMATLEQTKRDDEDLIERLQTELGAARMGLERSLDELERTKGSGDDKELRNIAAMNRDRDEIDRLRSELAAAKQALDINVEEMEKLNRCVKDADASRMIAVRQSHSSDQQRQEEIDELRDELAAKDEASKNHDEEVQRLRSQVAALQQELGEAMTYVEEMKEMIAKLQNAHHSELQDAQHDGKRTNRSHGKEMNTLKVELTKNQMSRADMEREHLKQVQDLQIKMDGIQTEMDKELREKERDLHQLQYTISRKDEEIRQLEKEREQICSSMNSISTNRKDEMDDLQEELLNLKAKTTAQTREIQTLKMQLEEHDFRQSEFQRLNERIEDLESELQNAPRQTAPVANNSGVEIMKAENKMLRESIRELTMERRTLQEKLEAHLAEKTTGSRSTQVLRERNAALKKEVERLTKRLKKMEHSMTRFTI